MCKLKCEIGENMKVVTCNVASIVQSIINTLRIANPTGSTTHSPVGIMFCRLFWKSISRIVVSVIGKVRCKLLLRIVFRTHYVFTWFLYCKRKFERSVGYKQKSKGGAINQGAT